SGLRQDQAALDVLQKAIDLQEKLAAEDAHDADSAMALGNSYNIRAMILSVVGRRTEEEAAFGKALAMMDEAVVRAPSQLRYQVKRAIIRGNVGTMYAKDRRLDEAEKLLRQNKDFWEGLTKQEPNEADYTSKLALTLQNLGQ